MPERRIEGAVVDLDGTVYRGDRLVPGADDAIGALRAAGVEVLFLSNKAIDRRASFSAKLTALGVPATADAVLNSASITATYLAESHPDDAVYVVGEPPLVEELADRDVRVTDDPAETDVLLASMDRSFDYEALTDALRAMARDPVFLATNLDRTCPVDDGEIPDCAGMVGAIEGTSGGTLDRVLGKPSQTTVDAAAAALGVPLDRCLMVGDRLETDVLMGNRAGMTTVLVMSGVTDQRALAAADVRPDHVVDSIAAVPDLLDD